MCGVHTGWFFPTQFVLVYHPPNNTSSDRSAFLSELFELFFPVCAMSPSTYLLGNMNCHVDSRSCTLASVYVNVGMFQFQSTCATHNRGDTLDLVCSTGTPPSGLQCLDLAVSSCHRFLCSCLPQGQRPKRTITFRNIKAVSAPALSTKIGAHLAGISFDPCDGDLIPF